MPEDVPELFTKKPEDLRGAYLGSLIKLARLKKDGERSGLLNEAGIKLINDMIDSFAVDCASSGVTDSEIHNILTGKLPEELRETTQGKLYIRVFEKGETLMEH